MTVLRNHKWYGRGKPAAEASEGDDRATAEEMAAEAGVSITTIERAKRQIRIEQGEAPRNHELRSRGNLRKQAIVNELWREQSGRCIHCGDLLMPFDFEVDHIHPFARGGGDEPDNLQLLCSLCNRRKANQEPRL